MSHTRQALEAQLAREQATSAELLRQLNFERAQHEETKHALKRSLAYGQSVTYELRDLKNAEQNG